MMYRGMKKNKSVDFPHFKGWSTEILPSLLSLLMSLISFLPVFVNGEKLNRKSLILLLVGGNIMILRHLKVQNVSFVGCFFFSVGVVVVVVYLNVDIGYLFP